MIILIGTLTSLYILFKGFSFRYNLIVRLVLSKLKYDEPGSQVKFIPSYVSLLTIGSWIINLIICCLLLQLVNFWITIIIMTSLYYISEFLINKIFVPSNLFIFNLIRKDISRKIMSVNELEMDERLETKKLIDSKLDELISTDNIFQF